MIFKDVLKLPSGPRTSPYASKDFVCDFHKTKIGEIRSITHKIDRIDVVQYLCFIWFCLLAHKLELILIFHENDWIQIV